MIRVEGPEGWMNQRVPIPGWMGRQGRGRQVHGTAVVLPAVSAGQACTACHALDPEFAQRLARAMAAAAQLAHVHVRKVHACYAAGTTTCLTMHHA